MLSALAQQAKLSVGASSAICALMGLFIVELACHWNEINVVERRASLVQAIAWLVVTALFSALPFVDWAAHLGGLVVGALLGCVFFANVRWTPQRQLAFMVAGIVALIVYCKKRKEKEYYFFVMIVSSSGKTSR